MIRFYYNLGTEFPYVASIDMGDLSTEIKVKEIQCFVPCRSFYEKINNQIGPTFVMICEGNLEIIDHIAYIR